MQADARGIVGMILIVIMMLQSALFQFYVCLPLYFLALLTQHAKCFQILSDTSTFFVDMFQLSISVLLEWFYKVRYVISVGDHGVDANGHQLAALSKLAPRQLFISNHRTRLDWMFLWPVLARCRSPQNNVFSELLSHTASSLSASALAKLHIIMKSDVKNIPLMGWATSIASYIFLHRNWAEDEVYLANMLKNISTQIVPASRASSITKKKTQEQVRSFSLLLFPEGTDLHDKAIEKSHAFAEKTNNPKLKYVLYPREKGFCYIVDTLRRSEGSAVVKKEVAPSDAKTQGPSDTQKVEDVANSSHLCIYDITMAYKPQAQNNEKQLLNSSMVADEVHIHIQPWFLGVPNENANGEPNDVSSLVKYISSEPSALGPWLIRSYQQKDAALAEWHAKLGAAPLYINYATTELESSVKGTTSTATSSIKSPPPSTVATTTATTATTGSYKYTPEPLWAYLLALSFECVLFSHMIQWLLRPYLFLLGLGFYTGMMYFAKSKGGAEVLLMQLKATIAKT